MSYTQFKKDLITGQKYEAIACLKYCDKYKTQLEHYNDDYKYDFKTANNIKIEVKYNFTALKYNSFFIEFFSRGKSSGINTTEADLYILTDSENYYIINVDVLKNIVKNCAVKSTNETKTFGYILPISILKIHSIILI